MNLSALNPPQREAVTHSAGPLLVLAGAGSGKTRVITYRIAHLLSRGVDARHIAALTFTNKAAEEMRHRVAALIRSSTTASQLTMGTFHSLGLEVLRADRAALGFPRGFVIYDGADQMGLVRELLRSIRIADRRFDARAILTRISLAKNAFVSPDEYEPAEADEYDEITAEIYPRYQRALRAFAAVDFDDLITEPVRLFETSPAVRERWRSRFRHVMVDEYQDTNRAQLMMVKALVEGHHNLCVVGDDDQSIYSWRGADPINILRFEVSFPGARVVVLEQNYRSTPTILAAANAVISNNTDRRGKTLWSQVAEGEPIVCAIAADVESEAKFVATEIQALCASDSRGYSDLAVLYRSNVQTRAIEEALREASIPYTLYGGQQFYERKEVKDILAYLRLALNPRDEIALRRVINYPARGIGATTIERLAAAATQSSTTLWRALSECEDIPPRARRGIDSFLTVMQRLSAAFDNGAAAAARQLIDDIDLYGDLRAASPSLTAAQRRIDNIEALLRSLDRHDRKPGSRGELSEYLRRLSLDTKDDDSDIDPGQRVVLTTLHGAKGLEFPVVFLIGAEEELLPHHRTLMPTATEVSDPERAADISEERRLAYVGITRAQQQLYITRCAARVIRGKPVPRTPSRFLCEIPAELIEERDVAAEARAPVAADEISSFFQSLSSTD